MLTEVQISKIMMIVKGFRQGYVLNFSNNTFRDFMLYTSGIDVYCAPGYTDQPSKGKKLQYFFRNESNNNVGKVILALLDMRDSIHSEDYIDKYEKEVAELRTIAKSMITEKTKEPISIGEDELMNKKSNRNVFIVHGHNEVYLLRVKDFVRDLNLDPIILKEKANSGMTIIEKIESYSDVAFGIVLYTACDLGKAIEEKEYNHRARQNVIFEHGYLMRKLGRDRVVALVEDGVETPGDLDGVVYIPLSNSSDWKFDVVREMNACGLNVSIK